jgi:hypothetical protein
MPPKADELDYRSEADNHANRYIPRSLLLLLWHYQTRIAMGNGKVNAIEQALRLSGDWGLTDE